MSVNDPEDGTRYEVLDVHHHVGSLDLGSVSGVEQSSYTHEVDAAMRSQVMDRFGVDAACVMPVSSWPCSTEARTLNEQIALYRNTHSDRFPYALGVTNIKDGVGGLKELEYLIKDLHLDGVVWHHRLQGAFVNHPFMTEALQFCERYRVPTFIHAIADSTMEAPWRISELVERFPGVPMVILDGFSSHNQAESMVQLGRRHPNLMFDLGAMLSVGNQIDQFVYQNGDDRLLLGTDLYLSPRSYHFPYSVYEVLHHSHLSQASKAKILAGNARRLFEKGVSL